MQVRVTYTGIAPEGERVAKKLNALLKNVLKGASSVEIIGWGSNIHIDTPTGFCLNLEREFWKVEESE